MVPIAQADAPEPGSLTPNRYFPPLTGLRAVAAWLVFLHHYNPAAPGTFAHRLFNQGYIGVSIFFVLSGFLMYHRYAGAYLSRKNWSWRTYLRNRFARIYPLYALLVLLTMGVEAALGHLKRGWQVVLDGTLLNGLFDAHKFGTIPQSWSLTVEMTFYGLAPFLFVGLRRWGAFRLTVLLVGTGLLLWVAMVQAGGARFLGSLSFVWFYTFFGRSLEFVVGLWLARQWHQNKLSVCSFSGLAGLGIVLMCVLCQAGASKYITEPATLLLSEVVLYNLLLPVGIGLLFVELLTRTSGMRNLLAQPVFQVLGRSSYAFYLIHVGVIAGGIQKAGVTSKGLLFCVLALLSWLIYQFLEQPLNQWIRKPRSEYIN